MEPQNRSELDATLATPAPPAAPKPLRDARGRFVKGSPPPNPGGRPKGAAELREALREYEPEAIQRLVALMRTARSEKVRLDAIREIFDRLYGRAPQAITGEDGGPVELTLRILRELADQARGEDGQERA